MLSGTVFVTILLISGVVGTLLAKLFEPEAAPWPIALVHILVAPAIFLASGETLVPQGAVLFSASMVLLLVALSMVDLHSRTIPDLLSLPLILLGLVYAVINDVDVLARAAAVAVVLVAAIITGWVGGRISRAVGAGDVLLVAGGIAWLGLALVPNLIITTSILLVLGVASATIARRRAPAFVPLAPAFGLAMCVIWLFGPIF